MDRPPRTPSPTRAGTTSGGLTPLDDPTHRQARSLVEGGDARSHSPALSAPPLSTSSAFPAPGSPIRPSAGAGTLAASSSPRRTPVPRPEAADLVETTSHVGASEAQKMLDQPADLLQAEERAVLEMLTSMSAPSPTHHESNPSSPSLRAASLPGVLPSNTLPAPLSNPASVIGGQTAHDDDAQDEAEVTSLIAPTTLGGATAVSYHSSDSSSVGQHSEESADTAFTRNLRALYRQQDPDHQRAAADAAGMDELGLPSAARVVHLEPHDDSRSDSDLGSSQLDDGLGLPPDFGYRAGFQTQPRMTFDVHTIEEVAEPSSSGASATSRSELSAPPPRPPARIGQSPFGSVSVGSPLGSRFRNMLQQQRDREQQGLGIGTTGGLLGAPAPVSPARSPSLQPFLSTQRSVSPLRSVSSAAFETPAETPNPTQYEDSPAGSALSGSQPSSPSKVRQLSRFFESSGSGSSDSDLSTSTTGRRAGAATAAAAGVGAGAAAAGVIGGAMAAAATRDRDRLRDVERSLASSPERRQPSGMTGSLSSPTLGGRQDTLGARSPIFTASRSLGTFGPQATTVTTAPTTLQHPVARRGMPTRPSVRSIAKQFATMIDDGSSSPRSGPPSPRKATEEELRDQQTIERLLGDTRPSVTTTAGEDTDVPLNPGQSSLNRNTFGTIRSFTRLSQDGSDPDGSDLGPPVYATDPPPRPSIRSGDLWYFNPRGEPPLWVEVQATLLVDGLELRWTVDDPSLPETAAGLRLDLTECEDAHSVFSPDHGSSFLDIGAQRAREQGLLRINPFQLQFPDGLERLATRTPMERLHWIDAIRDVLRQNIAPSTLRSSTAIPVAADVTPRAGASTDNREVGLVSALGQTEPLSTPTRGSFITAESQVDAQLSSPLSSSSLRARSAGAGKVTRLVSAFSEVSSDRTPLTARLGQTAEGTSGPPVPPKRDGEPSGNTSPGEPQYGEVNVTASRQVSDIPDQAARSIGASLDDRSTQLPTGAQQPSTIRPNRPTTASNFFEPASTLSNPSRMVTAGTGADTIHDEDIAFSVSSDIWDHFGPRTPPRSQVAYNFNRSGSLLEPSDSASNRVVPSEIGTIRREPPSPPPPFYAVSPERAETSGNARGVDSAGREPHNTPGLTHFQTPIGSSREAHRATSHLPLSNSELSLPMVPEEGPEGSRSASRTPTQLSPVRRALGPHDLNREPSVLSQRTVATHKTRATTSSIDPRDVAQLLSYLEEQARARQARDRYLEEQIKGFQDTIADLRAKRSNPSPPSEPSDSSGGQTMFTAPEDTPPSSDVQKPDTDKPQDELTVMQQKLDRVLDIVSNFQSGAALSDDVAKILSPAALSSLSSASQTFQTASAGIPSPPRSLSDGEDTSNAFQTAPTTQGSSTRPPLSSPSSWISGSTMLSNWTGKSDRIPPRSWTSGMSQPGAPPNSEYAPSSLGGPPSESDVTVVPVRPPPSVVPSAPTIPSAPSTVTVDMEAEVRKRRATRNAKPSAPPAVYPENQQNGWYTPRAPDGSPLDKDLPLVPGIRWTPGGHQPFRLPSILSSTAPSVPPRREVATYTQEDFAYFPEPEPEQPTSLHMPEPEPAPETEIEPPPEVVMEDVPLPPIDYPESNRASTISSNASAEFKEVLRKLQEADEARQQQQKQQADIARYLNELNAWLERDVMDRTKEWRALSSGVQQLSDDLNNVRNRPPVVQLTDPPRSDDDGRSSRPPRAESPTGPAALRPSTTLSLAPPIVAPQPYAGANWSNPDADRPDSDSGRSRRSGRVWSAQDDDDKEKEPKKEGLLSRVASKTGKVLLGTAAVGAAGLVGNEIRKHIERRDDKEKKEEKENEQQQRKDELDREKRQEKRDEQIRKDEAKDRKEVIAALAKEEKEKKKDGKDGKDGKDVGASEAVGAIAVAELARLASDKTGGGGGSTTVVTPAGTSVTTGKGGGSGSGSGGGGTTTAADAPTNPKGVWQTNLPRAERVQAALADADTTPTPLKDTIKSAFRPGTPAAASTANVATAAEATKEAAKANKEAATAVKEASTALNAAGGGTQKKNAKPATEGDAPAPAAPAVKVTPQPDGSVTVQATPAPAKGAKGAAAAPATVVATPAPAGGAPAAAVVPAAGGKAADKPADKGGDKKPDAKSVVKEAAGGAALTVAVEEILKHLLKQQDDARKQQDDAKKAEASLKAAQAEAEKKAKEAREKEKKEMVDALAAKLKEDQAKEAKAMDAKSAIEQLVANLNAQKAAEAKRQAEADAAIKKLADELLKLSAEQNKKAVDAVSAASKESVQKSVKDHNDELTKLLSKEVKAMFEDVGKIRETKRALELELADLFAIKARHLKDVAPPKAVAPAAKKGEEPKKEEQKPEPKKEEPKKEEKKPEPVKPLPLTVPLPDRLKYEPLTLNFGQRTAREGAAAPPPAAAAAAAAAPKGDKPKDKDAKDGKAK
ncbi:hypothetical protein V8E36_002995 [Tilletia maclaganii]